MLLTLYSCYFRKSVRLLLHFLIFIFYLIQLLLLVFYKFIKIFKIYMNNRILKLISWQIIIVINIHLFGVLGRLAA
jgi:hypothetical protein